MVVEKRTGVQKCPEYPPPPPQGNGMNPGLRSCGIQQNPKLWIQFNFYFKLPAIIYFYPLFKGTLAIAIFWALLSIVINVATPEVYSCTIAVLLLMTVKNE